MYNLLQCSKDWPNTTSPDILPSLKLDSYILLRFFNETSSLPVFTNLLLPRPSTPDCVWKPAPLGSTMHHPILSFWVMPCNWILSELNSDECTSSDLNSDKCNSCDLNSSSAVEKCCKFGRCESKSGWSCLLTRGGVGGHTSWLSGHCPLLALTRNQATVPFLRFWRHVSLVGAPWQGQVMDSLALPFGTLHQTH